jgi:hypothetical protein
MHNRLGDRCGRRGRADWNARMTRLFLVFLFLGQNRFHHIAGLRDVRQVNFWSDALLATGLSATGVGRGTRTSLKMRANLLGFVQFE